MEQELSIVTVLICSVLATQPDAPVTLDSFLVRPAAVRDTMFAGTPLAYVTARGRGDVVTELYRQRGQNDLFKLIGSDDDDYGRMDTFGKPMGLVKSPKQWGINKAPSKSAYKSEDNTPNPYFKGIFVTTENPDEKKPPDIIFCPASTVELILSGVQRTTISPIRAFLERLAKPNYYKKRSAAHGVDRKKRSNANTAESVAMRARDRRQERVSKQRMEFNEMDSAPDIAHKIDSVTRIQQRWSA
jgi:hypothetical protein